jgi:CBS domain-containing protein
MLVKDVMNPAVRTTTGVKTIQEATEEMNKYNIGCLIVVSEGRLRGIITERDILRKVVAKALNSAKVLVKDVMSKKVIMIGPDQDIQDAVDVMVQKKIKKLPVIDGSSLIGIVTLTDICMAEPKLIEKVSEIMLVPGVKKT